MTKERINQEYFAWMYDLVCEKQRRRSWRKLLLFLHEHEFVYILDMDANRANDGVDLRSRFFACKRNCDRLDMEAFMADRPCSILEMMVALAVRCEEHIMFDPSIGDRTGVWFWSMIQNLGLSAMDDTMFDEAFTERILTKFLKREYEPDGEGGLFLVEHPRKDLRTVEIWYQMMGYLYELV